MSTFFFLQNIYWREPLWLLLSFQPLIILLIKKAVKRNNISSYADKALQPWLIFPSNHMFTKLMLGKNLAYILAWVFISIALAGPRTPLSQVDEEKLYGANIMLVVDLSRSMRATDITPNRLRRATIEIHELLETAQNHRIGVTVFSARPHLFVPLTYDHNALKLYLEYMEDLSFPTMGSDPVAAILFAQKELSKIEGQSTIILITDGDSPKLSTDHISQLKTPLYILGIGSIEGEAIQTKNGKWLKYKQEDIVSRMNEKYLEQLASITKGKYSPVYDDNSDWNILYNQGVASHNNLISTDSKTSIVWQEYFHYFLIPSILLFWFSLSIYQFKNLRNISSILIIFTSSYTLPENNAHAFDFRIQLGQTVEQAAYRAYIDKEYSKANKIYQTILSYTGYMGQGNSLYRMGHYHKATQQFVIAALSAQTNKQRANSLYNLANSYFRTGDFTLAISTYQDALRYQPQHQAYLYNIKTSKKLKENIDQRLKSRQEIISSPRQGAGPRSASIAEGTEISENTSVSMGESNNTLNDKIPLPELPDFNEEQIRKLILSGLNNVKLAKQGSGVQQTQKQNGFSNVDLLNAQQQINIMTDKQPLLWKRLFEIEEGFPAPVDSPKVLPGVKPW